MTLTKENNDKLQGLDCHQVRMWLAVAESNKTRLSSLTDRVMRLLVAESDKTAGTAITD